MPITTLSAEQAQSNVRHNRNSIWPDRRKGKGRLGEYTVVDVKPSFSFSHADLIFTVGSCFARNIERKLGELGFSLPMLAITVPDEERVSDVANEIMNKYTTSAIVNELRWSLGLAQFADDALIEVEGGLVHDPHLHPQVPPVTRDRAVERRRQIHDVVRTVKQCRVFIITLGLVETWFDRQTGLYLNGIPPRGAIAAQPERFQLRRQSHAEILADLETIYDILRQCGHPEFKMIVSVSPVPFKATHTGQDAIAANTYSKSVLRAAAEEFVGIRENVDYFPSYEMVTLSDRHAAYWDDNIHVQEAMVSRIMDLAVSKYVPGYVPAESEDDITKFGNKPSQLLASARSLRSRGDNTTAAKLLQAIDQTYGIPYADMSAAEFYLLYGTTLARAGRNAEAEPHLTRAVSLAPDSSLHQFKLGLIAARLRRPHALFHFERAVEMEPDSAQYLTRLGVQYERLARPADARKAYERALAIDSTNQEARAAVDRLARTTSTANPIAA
jgi:hypothetical protein